MSAGRAAVYEPQEYSVNIKGEYMASPAEVVLTDRMVLENLIVLGRSRVPSYLPGHTCKNKFQWRYKVLYK